MTYGLAWRPSPVPPADVALAPVPFAVWRRLAQWARWPMPEHGEDQ